MSSGAVRKKGYLQKLPVKGFVKKWSRRWFVLYATSHEGVIRMEYFDNETCEKSGVGKRTIPLRDSSGIKQSVGDKTHPYVFELQSQIGFHKFACDTQPDLDNWVESIEEALHEDKMKRRQRKTQSLVINREEAVDYSDAAPSTGRKTSLASSSSEISEGTYRVTMEENETAEKMALRGEYNLIVSSTSLSLVSANSGATIAEWHFKFLKNYGKQHGRFHFETGKGSPTGPGKFVCVTTCSKEIFGVINKNIKRLREAKESQQKASLEQQVEEAKASQEKIRAERKAASLKKQSSADKGGQRSDKRSSMEVAGQPVAGSYRSSRDVDDLTTGHVQSPATASKPEDEFSGHLYSTVNKTKKPSATEDEADLEGHLYSTVNKTKKTSATGPPPKPQPYTTPTKSDTPQASASLATTTPDPFQAIPAPSDGDTNRHSFGSVRDSRDSALVQLDFLGSLDEKDEDQLSPITTGVSNPMGDESFTVPEKAEDLINFNLDDLDKNFFDQLDQLNLSGTGATGTSTGAGGGQFPPIDAGTPLDQQQFDQVWSSIFSNIPTPDGL